LSSFVLPSLHIKQLQHCYLNHLLRFSFSLPPEMKTTSLTLGQFSGRLKTEM